MPGANKKLDTSNFWFVIVPICLIVIFGLFLYIVFTTSTVQLIPEDGVEWIIKRLPKL
jgi:hypothetical protein